MIVTDPHRLSIAPAHVWRDTPMPDGGPPLDGDAFMPIMANITFDEFLRGLNPLHHIPVVGTIYRAATGETIPAPMRVLGGAAFGGVPGMLMTAAMVAVEQFQPMDRMRLALNNQPDPFLSAPGGPNTMLARTPAEALAAYARWTGVPTQHTALA